MNQVKEFLEEYMGKPITCFCGNTFKMDTFYGKPSPPHSHALMRNNKKWEWLYVKCPRCNYDWAYWKIEQRVKL